ncbi:hypothetical protein ACJZ2D_013105 [Fusarium nematophilum]
MASSNPPGAASGARLKIAIVGCGHGELDTIYDTLKSQCAAEGWALADVDFLIICGDFQASRNELDLNCMSVPRRYRKMGDFHKYYSGAAKAPVLTLVVGGNHEASNYFFELYHGGWLAPNIYYLGAASVVRYGPCRIAGLSGIYSAADYRRPHDERLPYDRDLVRSVYHVREHDVQKLLQVKGPVDIALSHDWPTWVELFGDHEDLFKQKPHFLASAKVDNLGSKPAAEVLNHLRPRHWFSGHMHVRFRATVEHCGSSMQDSVMRLALPEELRASLPIFKRQPSPAATLAAPSQLTEEQCRDRQHTEFLALSKPGRDVAGWMELVEMDVPLRTDDAIYSETFKDGRYALCYDEEWLAVTRAFNDALRIPDPDTLIVPPIKGRRRAPAPAASIPGHRQWVRERVVDRGLLKVPGNFVRCAPAYEADADVERRWEQPQEYPNPQTVAFSDLLEMPNKFYVD